MTAEPTATPSKATRAHQAVVEVQAADPAGAWLDLSPFQQARAWEKSAPETAKVVMKLAVRYANHQLAFQWLDRVITLGGVVALFILGWHYADVGAPASGL